MHIFMTVPYFLFPFQLMAENDSSWLQRGNSWRRTIVKGETYKRSSGFRKG
jgi:hypothetical protein